MIRKSHSLIVATAFLCLSFPALASSRFTVQVSEYGDDWLGSVFGSIAITDISENLDFDFEFDSAGYISLGCSYGWFFEKYYVGPGLSYGRGDFFDLIDLNLYAARILPKDFMLYGYLGHQWREANSFPIIGGRGVFDQRELMTALGLGYTPFEWLDLNLMLHFNRLLSGNDGITEVENPNITYQSLTIKYKPKYVHPFIRFTNGKHRVSPGDPVPTYNTFEVGLSASF